MLKSLPARPAPRVLMQAPVTNPPRIAWHVQGTNGHRYILNPHGPNRQLNVPVEAVAAAKAEGWTEVIQTSNQPTAPAAKPVPPPKPTLKDAAKKVDDALATTAQPEEVPTPGKGGKEPR